MIILQAIYFMLPAYFSNMAPVFATKIFGNLFNWPIDFGYKLNGRRILGKNKTWRGLIAAVVIGVMTVTLQGFAYKYNYFNDLSILDYTKIDYRLFGFLFGFGVILADAVKSFVKRRINLAPGSRWFFWDQLDFLGALILIHFVYVPSFWVILIIIIVSPILPLITNWLAYKLKLKKVAW